MYCFLGDSAEIKQRSGRCDNSPPPSRHPPPPQIVKITQESGDKVWLAMKYTGYIEIAYKLKRAFSLSALQEIVLLSWSSNNAQ